MIYKKDPVPSDPDELDFLPGAPGAIVRGWYRVQIDGDMAEPVAPSEGGEGEEPAQPAVFPENAEVS